MNDPRYPRGQAFPDDLGETTVAVGIEDNLVMMVFPKPMNWIGLEPDIAKEIGQSMIDRADEILKRAN